MVGGMVTAHLRLVVARKNHRAELQCVPTAPGLPTEFTTRLAAQRLGFGLANPSLEGGFEEFREFAPNCRIRSASRSILLGDTDVLLKDSRLQTGDLRGLRDDQLSELIIRRIGHKHIVPQHNIESRKARR